MIKGRVVNDEGNPFNPNSSLVFCARLTSSALVLELRHNDKIVCFFLPPDMKLAK
ncbi:hypothetical protein MFUM_1020023 [Methylacidiphilum fumariolicum SolV]|uniref:Uncharacterized protein n=2 Tax=Candidatus Methylacidiphilum fumarolicum TaxID=591154 RepID=I0JVN1_METFB|nr:conserved protein of unknown function [Candidatus Methylacidiphilum fumarolicum]CCG91300.1 hypothetical protein MFUM_1020023 [Methylacidiphilum fumariolicum SolV]